MVFLPGSGNQIVDVHEMFESRDFRKVEEEMTCNCDRCGDEITVTEYDRNGGICAECIEEELRGEK